MDIPALQSQRRLVVKQKLTLMVNQYVVTTDEPGGGQIVAYARQKRMAFKEQVTVYTDESMTQTLCSFKARGVLDAGTVYDVHDADGRPVGSLRKKFGASLLRSTWQMEQPGAPELTGRERSAFVAGLRRVWQVLPLDVLPFAWPYHFDFTDGARTLMTVDKRFGIRDHYVLDIASSEIDRRLAIAQAVALDALQAR